MKLMPRSLYGRLLALSVISTIGALVFAAFAIGAVLERFVIQGLDRQLDGQVALLATAVRPDGSIDHSRLRSPAPYDDPQSGWGWQIETPTGASSSPGAAADGQKLPSIPLPARRPIRPFDRTDPDSRPQPVDWNDRRYGDHHARVLTIATSTGPVHIFASAPRSIVGRPIRAAMTPLLGSLAALGFALALATLVQLRLGLRPLARLGESLAAVRTGRAEHVPADQPRELQPLTRELNALLDQNAAQLANARGHVANLAHGLKTPLASLALDLREGGRDPDGKLAAHVARIDRAIRHHLGRARADSAGGARPRIALAPVIEGLVAALARIHADRPVAARVDIAPDLTVAVDPHDLDEMLGNLLDNAWRFTTSRVAVDAAAQGGTVRITIADNGPGIPADRRDAAMQPGRRLDEAGDGHGFGLSIARELAELHGGRLLLAEASNGGLSATVELPD